jgi:SpoVK/Ycf46/Vps4 family AAA+-type ATPase
MDRDGKPLVYSASQIAEVRILPGLREVFDLMLRTCEFFFKGKLVMKNPPFRGFILEGLPGTGKTEIVRQMARKLNQRITSVSFTLVDGASIAAPKWGEGERNLRDAFHRIDELQKEQKNSKMVVLFDDIESLMISRGASMAKEWHYAINSILFHELDALDPARLIVCATSNRPDLVDDATKLGIAWSIW